MRKGFSLLELIFSITILSIIMYMFLNIFQIANMSNQNYSSNKNILNLETFLVNILKRSYDQNNTIGNNWKISLENKGSKYLQIPRIGKTQLNNNNYRKGNNKIPETNWNKLGPDKEENPNDMSTFNDIDDFNGYTLKYKTSNSKYKDVNISGYTFSSKVYYTNDNFDYSSNNNSANYNYSKEDKNTNIKTIEVLATNQNLNKKIVFYYNSTNIGGSHLYSLSEISK